jgi:hypothetical protein
MDNNEDIPEKVYVLTKLNCGVCGTYKGASYCKVCQRQKCREYKARHREEISAYNKVYKNQHKEKISKYNHNYSLDNRKEIQTRHTKYLRKRRYEDLKYKMETRLRNRIRRILKEGNYVKSQSTIVLMGCTKEFLLEWFEFLFDEQMTFDNHGTIWHIDHVIPCTLFDMTNHDDQRKCFHWTNLKPMISKKNQSKGNRLTYDELYSHEINLAMFCMKNPQYFSQVLYYKKDKYVNENLQLPSCISNNVMALGKLKGTVKTL